MAIFSSQVVAVGSASNEEEVDMVSADAREHVTVPIEVEELGVDMAAVDTDWDV